MEDLKPKTLKIKLYTILINLFIVLLSLLLFFVVGELSARIYKRLFKSKPLISARSQFDYMNMVEVLGWIPEPNMSHIRKSKDASGKEYDINYRTNKYGSRIFGDPKSNKTKVFFIGDSFTQAGQVSNQKTYYAIIGSKLNNIEIFSYGVGGYGNLQEFIILDKFIDVIKPDIIVLQLCYNDFINNDYELEYRSYMNNNGKTKPYLTLENEIIRYL
jgi:hypothetical protein